MPCTDNHEDLSTCAHEEKSEYPIPMRPAATFLKNSVLTLARLSPFYLSRPHFLSVLYRLYYRLSESESNDGLYLKEREQGLTSELEDFQNCVRKALTGIHESQLARRANSIAQKIERNRGLGNVGSLPTYWIIELADISPQRVRTPSPSFLDMLRFASHIRLLFRDSNTFTPVATEILDKASLFGCPWSAIIDATRCDEEMIAALLAWHPGEIIIDLSRAARSERDFHEALRRMETFKSRASFPRISWRLFLDRTTLWALEQLASREIPERWRTLHLYLARAYTPEEVSRSLFFSRRLVRELISAFQKSLVSKGWQILFGKPDRPEERQRQAERAFGTVHVRATGSYAPCVGNGGSDDLLSAWDSLEWKEYRRKVCVEGPFFDCPDCEISGSQDVFSVPYLLAAYERGVPSQEYIDAVRCEIDAIEDISDAREINALVRDYEHKHAHVRLASYPHRMYIEVTDECNLRCPMCTQTVLSGPRRRISLETFSAVKPLLRYVELLHFTGCGETFLHPQILDMLEAVPHDQCKVRIITNGLLLDEATSRRLVELGLQDLWISLDATDAPTFQKIRGSKLFHRVLDNVRTLSRIRRELGSTFPRIALNFVAQRSNIEQLPAFVKLAHELGADAVNVGFLQVYTRALLTESLYFYQELSDRFMGEAQQVAQELGIDIYLPGFFAEARAASSSKRSRKKELGANEKCVEPYGFVFVHADGSLGPCCVNDSRLGSLGEGDFLSQWNGDLYRDFRERVNTPAQDFDCEHCMLEGYKEIHEFEHHVKLFTEEYERETLDYRELEKEVRELIAREGRG